MRRALPVFLLSAGCAICQPFRDPSLAVEVRAADVVSRLTLAERISLMSHLQPAVPRLQPSR